MTEQEKSVVYIKMKTFYHGRLNDSVRWEVGTIHQVAHSVAQVLIERGKAHKNAPSSAEIKAANA